MSARLLTPLALILAAGCSFYRPAPQTIAAQKEPACSGETLAEDPRVVGPQNVERAEPLYSHVHTHPNMLASRLIGAELHVRPIDGVTDASFARALTCHAARETLAAASADPPADPYWIPDSWVDITVHADGTGYVVDLTGEDFDDAERILARAEAFARK